jgi:hypothetical protein
VEVNRRKRPVFLFDGGRTDPHPDTPRNLARLGQPGLFEF